MIILIEKIFAKEALNFEHPSPDLVFFKAEKRGAQNARFIISMIQHKKRPKTINQKNELGEVIEENIDYEKITFKEYIRGLRELKNLYKRILPSV